MCNFWLNFFGKKNTLQFHSGGLQQLPIVPKIGVHSSWSGEKVVRKKKLSTNKIAFEMCNFWLNFFGKKTTLQLHSGGLQQLPIVPKIGVHSSWSGEKVVRKKL